MLTPVVHESMGPAHPRGADQPQTESGIAHFKPDQALPRIRHHQATAAFHGFERSGFEPDRAIPGPYAEALGEPAVAARPARGLPAGAGLVGGLALRRPQPGRPRLLRPAGRRPAAGRIRRSRLLARGMAQGAAAAAASARAWPGRRRGPGPGPALE